MTHPTDGDLSTGDVIVLENANSAPQYGVNDRCTSWLQIALIDASIGIVSLEIAWGFHYFLALGIGRENFVSQGKNDEITGRFVFGARGNGCLG